MDKKYVIALCAASAFVGGLATAIITAPSDMEILDMAANMPAERLKEAARTTTNQFKEVKEKADILNARKTVILAVQDANS